MSLHATATCELSSASSSATDGSNTLLIDDSKRSEYTLPLLDADEKQASLVLYEKLDHGVATRSRRAGVLFQLVEPLQVEED